MKAIIIYATQHGSTETVAQRLQKYFAAGSVDLMNLKEQNKVDFSAYEIIILGSSIHAGNNQRSMKNFIAKHITELLQKQVALYLCCMRQDELEKQMGNAYPEVLRNKAFSYRWAGGEYIMEKMNFIEKFLLKKIAGVTESQSHLNNQQIDLLIEDIKKQWK